MKWLIFCGLLFFHLSVAQIDGTCEECIDFIQASSQLFANNEVVDITGTFLKQNVCPQMSDVEGTQSLKITQKGSFNIYVYILSGQKFAFFFQILFLRFSSFVIF